MVSELRPIAAADFTGLQPGGADMPRPRFTDVEPKALYVDETYQRELSKKSRQLIRRIVGDWDWRRFKPPIVVQTEAGLEVVDGQHTAIAAASHPAIATIPVMIIEASERSARAAAFIGHNRDRIGMSIHQIFHAEVAAGVGGARDILAIALKVGAVIPRSMPNRVTSKAGNVAAVAELSIIFVAHGAAILERVLKIAVIAKESPLQSVAARGLRLLLTNPQFSGIAKLEDEKIAAALSRVTEFETRRYAQDKGKSRAEACADLIAKACGYSRPISSSVTKLEPKKATAPVFRTSAPGVGFRPAARKAVAQPAGVRDVSDLVFDDPKPGRRVR